MCIEDMAIGRHTRKKTTTLDMTAGPVVLAGSARRVALLWSVPEAATLLVSVPGEGNGPDAVIYSQSAAVGAINPAPGRLHLAEYGQVVTGPLIFSGAGGPIAVVEVLTDDELDEAVNNHWDRMWRTGNGQR